jgi:hypothetical protein
MLEKFLKSLCSELSISPIPQRNKENFYLLPFNDTIAAKFMDLEPGISVSSNICDCPKLNREDLFIWIMRANLLGQGTGGCRIGLTNDEKVLTLSLGLPYEMNYSTFKEKFEDFINYVIYWRDEIAKFEAQGTQ